MFFPCSLRKYFFPFVLLSTFAAVARTTPPADSIGTEKKGDRLFVLFKVAAGDNLTKIARKYKTSISEIVKENELPEQKIKIDQVLRIPYTAPKVAIKTEPVRNPAEAPVHTVKAGEGLYSISKKYKVSIADLKKWNDLDTETLKEGQVLVVGKGKAPKTDPPKTEPEKKPEPKKDTEPETLISPTGQKIHIVKPGEGLFRISQTYKISLENLRKWNNLDSDNLSLGQELILEEPASTTPVAKKDPDPQPEKKEPAPEIKPDKPEKKADEKKQEDKKADEKKTADKKEEKAAIKEEKKEEKKAQKEEKTEKNPNNYTIKTENGYPKQVETGMAEVIDDPESTGFFALHRTAPVGTIMQVRNLSNDLSVFVRVIGKLPDTGANDKLIVKVSKRAYDRLGAIDKRFRAEVSYLPQ